MKLTALFPIAAASPFVALAMPAHKCLRTTECCKAAESMKAIICCKFQQ
jgi:hypothetical protein